MAKHWLEKHRNLDRPPTFKFKVVARFRDCLSRQLCESLLINEYGHLNSKSEFNNNSICRLEVPVDLWSRKKNKPLVHLCNRFTSLSVCLLSLPSLKSWADFRDFWLVTTLGSGMVLG